MVLVGLLDEESDAAVGAGDDADGLMIVSFSGGGGVVCVNRRR